MIKTAKNLTHAEARRIMDAVMAGTQPADIANMFYQLGQSGHNSAAAGTNLITMASSHLYRLGLSNQGPRAKKVKTKVTKRYTAA
jgi:hypothetical protein